MGNQGRNDYSEWVSKMRFFDNLLIPSFSVVKFRIFSVNEKKNKCFKDILTNDPNS